MSQDGSRHPTNSDLSDELVLAKHCLVETNLNDLMDKPFLEPSLNQSVPLLPDPRPAVRDTLQPVYQPITVILVLRTFIQSLRVIPYHQPASYVASTRRLSLPSSEPTYQSDLFASQSVNNRFILCLVCASVTVMPLLWAGSQVISSDNVAPPVLTTQQGVGLPAVSAADIQSAHKPYPQGVKPRKLPQLVDRSAKQSTPSTTAIQPAKVSLPANPQVPANTVISVPARVTERIFVPVYRPSPAQAMASKPQATYRASVASATPSVSASPVASPSHTLVGVMEFGDRSAALIDVNHVIQRIEIGELTPDGWKLTKVIDQKAVLQREDKLRSIYVGQKF